MERLVGTVSRGIRTPISEYAAQCGADEILVLYQIGNFAEDVNVGLLSR